MSLDFAKKKKWSFELFLFIFTKIQQFFVKKICDFLLENAKFL